jgi:hypothetical protein
MKFNPLLASLFYKSSYSLAAKEKALKKRKRVEREGRR